ncbi:hypothetical protein B0E53_07049 [Micromonospora sp. MH33]|nr:hypothetical protein B0E53_07049 [Micromonospora sp. MH33]
MSRSGAPAVPEGSVGVAVSEVVIAVPSGGVSAGSWVEGGVAVVVRPVSVNRHRVRLSSLRNRSVCPVFSQARSFAVAVE